LGEGVETLKKEGKGFQILKRKRSGIRESKKNPTQGKKKKKVEKNGVGLPRSGGGEVKGQSKANLGDGTSN